MPRGVARIAAAAPLLLALVAALAVCAPAVLEPNGTLLCGYIHPDCLGNHWLMVWVAEQVMHGRSILWNDSYYWPVGDAPWLAGNGSEGFAYLPFHALLGWPLGSNVYLFGILTLNGVAAYQLARASGAGAPAALAAAPTMTLSIYTLQELGAGRYSQVSICWMTFFLASWLRFLDAPSHRRALAAAGLLALTSLFYWYYGLFSVMAGALLIAARGRATLRTGWRPLLGFAVAYLVLIGPLLWVYLRYWASIPGTAEEVFPHPEAVGDSTWPGIPFLVTSGRHSGRAMPALTLLLAAVGLTHARRRTAWAWAAVAVLFAALMAGPLIPNGPYVWIYGLARPLRRFWWPYRHVVVLNLALTTLAALGADRLLARLSGARAQAAGWALALAVPLQLQLQGAPWHAQFSTVVAPEPFYARVAAMPGARMIEPPLAPALASSETPLIYQLYHRKQLVNGHAEWVDRVRPDAWDDFVAHNSFLSEMQRLERGEAGDHFTFDGADLKALLDQDVRVMVLNREYFPTAFSKLIGTYAEVFEALFGPPVEHARRARAWDMGRWNGATSVPIEPTPWPARVQPGGPTLAVQGMHEPSIGFSMPAPPKREKPQGPPPPGGPAATPASEPPPAASPAASPAPASEPPPAPGTP